MVILFKECAFKELNCAIRILHRKINFHRPELRITELFYFRLLRIGGILQHFYDNIDGEFKMIMAAVNAGIINDMRKIRHNLYNNLLIWCECGTYDANLDYEDWLLFCEIIEMVDKMIECARTVGTQ